MNLTLMHNPGAGSESCGAGDLVALLEAAGHTVRYRSTDDEGRTDELGMPADLIVAAGGDGMVGRILIAMPGGAAPVAALPFGSANNIARALGVAGAETADLARAWERGRIGRFDLSRIAGGGHETCFAEGAGGGVFGAALVRAGEFGHEPSGDAKRRHGLELLAGVIAEAQARRWAVTVDGEDLSGDYIAVEVMNIGEIGPNLPLAPGADPGDGLLDVVLVPPGRREALAAFVAARLDGRAAPDLDLPSRRGRVVELGIPAGCPFHLDDELWPGEDAPAPPSVRVVAAAGCVEVLNHGTPRQGGGGAGDAPIAAAGDTVAGWTHPPGTDPSKTEGTRGRPPGP